MGCFADEIVNTRRHETETGLLALLTLKSLQSGFTIGRPVQGKMFYALNLLRFSSHARGPECFTQDYLHSFKLINMSIFHIQISEESIWCILISNAMWLISNHRESYPTNLYSPLYCIVFELLM